MYALLIQNPIQSSYYLFINIEWKNFEYIYIVAFCLSNCWNNLLESIFPHEVTHTTITMTWRPLKMFFPKTIKITYLHIQLTLGQNFNYIIHNQPLEGLKSYSNLIFCSYKIWQNSLFSPFGGSCKKTNNIKA